MIYFFNFKDLFTKWLIPGYPDPRKDCFFFKSGILESVVIWLFLESTLIIKPKLFNFWYLYKVLKVIRSLTFKIRGYLKKKTIRFLKFSRYFHQILTAYRNHHFSLILLPFQCQQDIGECLKTACYFHKYRSTHSESGSSCRKTLF